MSNQKKLIIGLTGGIGSGKSVVANYFKEFGITIIEADNIAREIVSPGSTLLKKIQAKLGNNILNIDGSLNRKLLREKILQDIDLKKWLEQLLHPVVCQLMIERATQADSPYCVLVIPLLIELLESGKACKPHNDKCPPYGLDAFIDRILLVDTPLEHQIQRTQERDKVSHDEALGMIAAQTSKETRLHYADDIIENTKNLPFLKEQVKKLHHYYLSLIKK